MKSLTQSDIGIDLLFVTLSMMLSCGGMFNENFKEFKYSNGKFENVDSYALYPNDKIKVNLKMELLLL